MKIVTARAHTHLQSRTLLNWIARQASAYQLQTKFICYEQTVNTLAIECNKRIPTTAKATTKTAAKLRTSERNWRRLQIYGHLCSLWIEYNAYENRIECVWHTHAHAASTNVIAWKFNEINRSSSAIMKNQFHIQDHQFHNAVYHFVVRQQITAHRYMRYA